MTTEQPGITQSVRDQPVGLGRAQAHPSGNAADTDTDSAKRRPVGFVEGAAEFGGYVVGFVLGMISS